MIEAEAISVRGGRRRRLIPPAIGVVLAALCCPTAVARQLTDVERARVDSAAQAVLAATGAPLRRSVRSLGTTTECPAAPRRGGHSSFSAVIRSARRTRRTGR